MCGENVRLYLYWVENGRGGRGESMKSGENRNRFIHTCPVVLLLTHALIFDDTDPTSAIEPFCKYRRLDIFFFHRRTFFFYYYYHLACHAISRYYFPTSEKTRVRRDDFSRCDTSHASDRLPLSAAGTRSPRRTMRSDDAF